MHQLALFAPTAAPAKPTKKPALITPPAHQEKGIDCLYPQPCYGLCTKCESSIIQPGLDTCKCSGCGYVQSKFVKFTVDAPAIKPVTSPNIGTDANTAISVEKSVTSSSDEKSSAKGKVLSMFTTNTRAKKLGRPDPFLSGVKICTRRFMADSTVAWYQRAFEAGQTAQVYSSGQYAGGIKWADVRLTRAPYQQALKDMQPEDLVAEGDLWDSKEEFIADVCMGRPDPEAMPWVLWFEVVKMYV